MTDEYRICARPMKRAKADRRPVPVTCHHFVLAELLQYVPRALAEMIEEYRLSICDSIVIGGAEATISHACAPDEEVFYCALQDVRMTFTHYDDIVVHVSRGQWELQVETHIFCNGTPMHHAVEKNILFGVKTVLGRRTPCDLLVEVWHNQTLKTVTHRDLPNS